MSEADALIGEKCRGLWVKRGFFVWEMRRRDFLFSRESDWKWKRKIEGGDCGAAQLIGFIKIRVFIWEFCWLKIEVFEVEIFCLLLLHLQPKRNFQLVSLLGTFKEKRSGGRDLRGKQRRRHVVEHHMFYFYPRNLLLTIQLFFK